MTQEKEQNLIPWDEVMAFGFGILKLSSNDFWAMTLREIKCAMKVYGHESHRPLSRASFERLVKDFPDKPVLQSQP